VIAEFRAGEICRVMIRPVATRSDGVDLTTCDREAIHIPGSIQPSGALLALETTGWTVLQASENVDDVLGENVAAVLGKTLEDLFGETQGSQLQRWLAGLDRDREAQDVGALSVAVGGQGKALNAVAHRSEDVVILELEPITSDGVVSFRNLSPLVRTFLAGMDRAATVDDLCRFAVGEVRRISGFDRALVYRFDDDGAGTVIAEDRNDALPSYLDHRFPASDIPAQARELYRRNRFRLIADAESTPVPIVPPRNPRTDRPLDLSHATLRSVSPVHVESMKNMGTAASMSISILRNGGLWGLISCHNATRRDVPFAVRTACDLLGQVFSLQLDSKERHAEFEYRLKLTSVQVSLLAHMANEEEFIDGLVKHPGELLEFADAGGAAVVFDGKCHRVGTSPGEAEIMRIVDWLSVDVAKDVFSTESLSEFLPEAEAYKDQASGLLAISISKLYRSYILWFRPEVLQRVKWAGDPRKPVEDPDLRPQPRRSFEAWTETVRLRSQPWRTSELETAVEFRNAVVGIVLRKAEELAELSAELRRSNKELEAFSYSVSHDLRAPLRHIVGYAELLNEQHDLSETGRRYVRTIIESAYFAGVLVDNLLAFSQMARAGISPMNLDMNRLVEEVRAEVMAEAAGRTIRWHVERLPEAWSDPVMMRLVLRNLLSNAVKYTRKREEAAIEVGSVIHPAEIIYFVRDNGTGFDMRYVDKLFGVFQRLHRMEEFEGTGIGLANVRRIIERQGGRTWAEGIVDQGATFYFSLPRALVQSEGRLC
jgi:chemotaxis family two-component system sensor kinase Cph1